VKTKEQIREEARIRMRRYTRARWSENLSGSELHKRVQRKPGCLDCRGLMELLCETPRLMGEQHG